MKELDESVKWFNTVFFPKKRVGKPAKYEDSVLPRLRADEIVLFTPWGPRYSWESRGILIQEADREVEVLKFLADLFGEMQQNMPNKKFRWLFLGADLYGTRINKLPAQVVAQYFCSLAEWLPRVIPVAEFQLWSQFDGAAQPYRDRVRDNLPEFISPAIFSRAIQTAKAMGRNSSAQEYLTERLAEAMLFEETLQPIKVSCVAGHKDTDVDWQLPRLYFLPEHLHACWL